MGKAALVLALALALIAAPNAIGLAARLSTLGLKRFSAWWPPAGIEPLPLGVAALVILVTAYALATHGSRRRSPGLPAHRRYLPALELLLLQLGNVTFLAFAVVLAVVTLGLLSSALGALVDQPWLVANNFVASLVVAAVVVSPALRRRPTAAGPRGAPWRRRTRDAAILGCAVGGLWLIGRAPSQGLLSIRLADSQLDPSTLASLYTLLWIALAGAMILGRFDRPPAGSAGPTAVRRSLAVSSPLAWTAYLGLLTLYLNGALLTIRGHLAGR